MDGDVTVAVEWTTMNYKDGLAITGKAPVVRRFPLVPGHRFRRNGAADRRTRLGRQATRWCSTAGASARPIGGYAAPGPRQGRLAGAAPATR